MNEQKDVMLEITNGDIERWKDFRNPNRDKKKKSFEEAIDKCIAEAKGKINE